MTSPRDKNLLHPHPLSPPNRENLGLEARMPRFGPLFCWSWLLVTYSDSVSLLSED